MGVKDLCNSWNVSIVSHKTNWNCPQEYQVLVLKRWQLVPTDNWCQRIIGANRSKTRHSGLVSYNWIMHVVYRLFVIMFQSQLLRKKSLNWTSLKLLWDIIPNGCCPRLFVGWHDVNLRTVISDWKLGLSSVSLARNGSCRLAVKNFKSMFSLKK